MQTKEFFILPSELFCNVRARAFTDPNLNETLEKVFRHIEDSAKGSQSEGDFEGLFDDFDANSNKLGSTVAKRTDGEFFSPADVSELLTRLGTVGKTTINKV